jgi:hypothetical protein
MAKWSLDANMDAMLANIANNADALHVCSGQPANFEGIAAVELASVALTVGDGNGDYTVGDGDASGRKLTVAAQNGLTVDADGTATHISADGRKHGQRACLGHRSRRSFLGQIPVSFINRMY